MCMKGIGCFIFQESVGFNLSNYSFLLFNSGIFKQNEGKLPLEHVCTNNDTILGPDFTTQSWDDIYVYHLL